MSKVLNITLPILSLADVQVATAGIRPFRKGGIRFAIQQEGNKTVYHNYGHGGAGVSMSYGCASMMTQKFFSQLTPLPKQVAVLGSGYMGLFTAKILQEAGFKVRLYSKCVPLVMKQGTSEIASEAAAGLWLPYGYDLDEQNATQTELHDLASKISFDFFKLAMQQDKYKGITKITCVFLNRDPRVTFKKQLPSTIDMNYQEQMISINGGTAVQCVTMDSLMIEGQIFLADLIQECRSLGVQFVETIFQNQEDIQQLKEEVLFNCLGYDAGRIFENNSMVPYRGQIVYCKAFKDFNYYIGFINARGESVATYPHKNYTGIGLTREVMDNPFPNIQSSTLLINNYNEMVLQHSQAQPKL